MKRFGMGLLALAACGGGSAGAVDGGGTIDGMSGEIDAPSAAADASGDDAAACLPVSTDLTWLEDYQREVVGKLSGQAEIFPGVTLTNRASSTARTNARDYLITELSRWGYEPAIMPWDSGANVIAARDATTGDQAIIVIGAHFDGVPGSPAAADDGTGVAIVLSAARHFAGTCSKRRLYLMLFDQEEIGLVGSDEAAAQFQLQGADIEAVHAFDMISWDSNGDGAMELWDPSPPLVTLYQSAGTTFGIPVGVENCHCSDHQSFLDHGFTATGVGEQFIGGDANPNYHLPTDTYANVNFPYLAATTEMIFSVLETQLTP